MITKAQSDEIIYQFGRARSVIPKVIRRPLGYFLYITGRCNLNCTYCWQRHQDDNPHGLANSTLSPLAPEEWVRVVERLPRPSFLGLSGGESTISPAFGPIIEAATQRGRLALTVNTNGVSWKPSDIDLLTSPAVRNISVSIDGFRSVHDASRNRKGLFDKIVANIAKLNERRSSQGRPSLTIKTVLTDDSLDQLVQFREFCAEELKADTLNISFEKTGEHYQFSLLHHRDLDELFDSSESRLYSYRRRDEIVDVLEALLRCNRRSSCEVVVYPRMTSREQIAAFLQADGVGVYAPCHLPSAMVVVLPDGEVIPCQSFALGNVRDHAYEVGRVLKGDRYREFRERLSKCGSNLPDGCQVCCYAKVNKPADAVYA
jgi:radical SAM protein with 4Fe4S-binding SPASM domain